MAILVMGCATNEPKLADIHSEIDELDRNMRFHQEKYQGLQASRQRILDQMKTLFETEIPSITERQELLQPKESDFAPKETPSSSYTPPQESSAPERGDVLDLFHKANADYNQGNYTDATEKYMMVYDYATTADMKARCLYRIGDCHYRVLEWDEAIRFMTRIETDFPNHVIIPSAMLIKGFSQYFNGMATAGKQTLQTLIVRYPDSDEAALAAARLEELEK